jgi:hypothetical protein
MADPVTRPEDLAGLLAGVLHDAIPCRWKAHAGFTAKSDADYHRGQADRIVSLLDAALTGDTGPKETDRE